METTSTTIIVQNPVNSRICKVVLINLETPEKPTRAFVDVRFGPFILHGFAVIRSEKEGKRSYWVSAPARFDKARDKSYPHITVDDDFKRSLYIPILEAFKKAAIEYADRVLNKRSIPAPAEPPDSAEITDQDIPF